MSQTLMAFILNLLEAAKENDTGPIVCCWCNNRENIIKYGTYQRYGFTTEELIKIQRYLCKHDQCRRTFSILPHPFLRITRFSLCMLREFLRLHDLQLSRGQAARLFAVSWPTIDRAIKRARKILVWVRQEAMTQPTWTPTPCMRPSQCWSDFIRMFAAHFYPKRYANIHQHNLNI